MSISDFVRRTQHAILVASIANILLLAASVLLGVWGLAAFLAGDGSSPMIVSGMLAGAFVVYAIWRARALRSRKQIALWIEELVPTLHYAVVTASENDFPEIERSVRVDAIRPVITRRLATVSAKSVGFLVLALAIFLVSPATSLGRGRIRSSLSRSFPGAIAPIDKIARLRTRVIPPAYSDSRPSEQNDATSVRALAGSKVIISGNGSPDGVSVTIDGTPMRVTGNRDSWTSELVAATPIAAIHVSFHSRSRVLILESWPDNPPRVTLSAPLRDSTLRTANFSVFLHATANDDIGLTTGYFEYLIVSGSGEAFTGRTVTSTPVHFDSRSGTVQARLDFSAYKIGAGDLISIRAIARDNNTLTGPSIGTSDTRTFRVARADEYDSVSVEAAAPPPVDSSAMSQRMLIIMTEALVKKQKSLSRQQLVKLSDDIGFMEDRIRKRVYDILYQTDSPEGAGDTEEAESELQAVNNPDLKQAYDALWDAVRSLRIAEPAVALPPMRVALKALDRARLAKRIYLRGAAPGIVVDVGHVRLTGKERGTSSLRTRQFAADSSRRTFAYAFENALAKRKSDPRATLDGLSLLRVRALQSAPEFARALGESIDLIQKNQPAEKALGRARKALQPSPFSKSAPGDWGGG